MKPSLHTSRLVMFTCWLFLMAACSKDPSANTTPAPPPDPPAPRDSILPPQPAPSSNLPPVADAGPDQDITLPTDSARLSGKGTDADGTITSYRWYIIGYHTQRGREVNFSFSTQEIILRNLEEGTYWCRLTVGDNEGAAHTDEAFIKVVSPGCPCSPDPCDAVGDPCDPWDY